MKLSPTGGCTGTDKPACPPLKNGIKGKPYFCLLVNDIHTENSNIWILFEFVTTSCMFKGCIYTAYHSFCQNFHDDVLPLCVLKKCHFCFRRWNLIIHFYSKERTRSCITRLIIKWWLKTKWNFIPQRYLFTIHAMLPHCFLHREARSW